MRNRFYAGAWWAGALFIAWALSTVSCSSEGVPPLPDTFSFSDEEANCLYSLSQYSGDCDIHIIYEVKKSAGLTFVFVRDGKQILALRGHSKSAFFSERNRLFFAHFGPDLTGCTVAAYDLSDGKTLWRTELKGIGPVSHKS